MILLYAAPGVPRRGESPVMCASTVQVAAPRAIRSQILTVFFMPILVAAVHIAFDFNLVVQLLRLFSLTNLKLTALCTLGTLLVFCAVYAVVYALTARSYYKIVRPNSESAR